VQAFTYDLDGKVESVALDGTTIADPVYASSQLLQSVSYLNGTSLSLITRNPTGATTSLLRSVAPGRHRQPSTCLASAPRWPADRRSSA
jgi:hypothetical protein